MLIEANVAAMASALPREVPKTKRCAIRNCAVDSSAVSSSRVKESPPLINMRVPSGGRTIAIGENPLKGKGHAKTHTICSSYPHLKGDWYLTPTEFRDEAAQIWDV